MNIGIMCHSSFGGSARIGTELAKELACCGHRVHLFTRTVPFGSWDPDSGVTLHRTVAVVDNTFHPATLHTDWPDEEFNLFLSNVTRVIEEEGLDVLHFHYAVPFAFIAEEVKRRLGKLSPLLVGTLHGSDVTVYGRDAVRGPRLARTLKALDGLTTVSKSHADLSREVFGLKTSPEVISNFVDLKRFRPLDDFFRGSRKLPVDDHDRVPAKSRVRIAHISNFRPVKDLEGLSRIFVKIRQVMEAELWLVGDGQEMHKIKTILKSNGVDKDIYYWGLRRNVAPILAQADMFLISSHWESFCLVALEAMACGVPVIATRVGGLPEVVLHDQTGFLYSPGDYCAAAGYAVRLLNDPVKMSSMREAAAKHACRFDSRVIPEMYEAYYRELLFKKTGDLNYLDIGKVGINRETLQSGSVF
ncbi:MAG: N-acetyl-alpha-D-glucosaminyl L-malate synthase BshA [bacterium]|nr:N-acetyl-alpha-D-glucosaminyl L-malate synthase BshA [bacterium]